MSARILRRLAMSLAALLLSSGLALAQSKVIISVGGAGCLCYLPTMLAQELGEYKKAGLDVEIVDFKGGSQSLTAVIGGSADVVSGYFDHCVNLAAKNQSLVAFVVYDRYPGFALVVSPKHKDEIKSIKDLAGKKIGVSAPGSSTDFFLKFLLKKNGLDPASAAVIGVGLGATAVAAMEQGQIDAAVMLDPSVTVLQGSHPDLRILSDTRTQKDTLDVFGGEYPGGALYSTTAWVASHDKEVQALTNAIVNTTASGPSSPLLRSVATAPAIRIAAANPYRMRCFHRAESVMPTRAIGSASVNMPTASSGTSAGPSTSLRPRSSNDDDCAVPTWKPGSSL